VDAAGKFGVDLEDLPDFTPVIFPAVE